MKQNKKLVVLGGKSFVVEVLGDNPHIKGSVYVRYQEGGTDSFKPRFLIDLPEIHGQLEEECKQLQQDKAELVSMLEVMSSFYGCSLKDDGINPETCQNYAEARALVEKHKCD